MAGEGAKMPMLAPGRRALQARCANGGIDGQD